MKKLMIALTAMAATALVAKAGPWVGVTFDEIVTGGGYITGNPLNVQLDDSQLAGGSGPHLWYSAAASTEVGHAGEVESTIAEENGNKFLAVEETVVLERKIAEEPQNIGDGIAINTKVQFTAADEAPEAVDGDKLIVWMRAASEAEGTEGEEGYKPALCAAVMVTDKNGATAIKELADDEVETYTAAWHTLKVMAVTAGTEAQPTASFTVELDGDVFDGTFDSMVKGGDAAQTIASVGFKGTGKVDDISFEPMEAAGTFTVEVTATGTSEYGIGDDMVTSETFTVGEKSVDIYVGVQDGETVTCNIAGAEISDPDEDGYVTVTIPTASVVADAVVSVEITVVSGGDEPEVIKPTVTPADAVVEGLAASYKPGQTIDPATITAESTKNGYQAIVTVKVNDEAITAPATLKSGDTISVEVSEEAITYEITYTYVDVDDIPVEGVTNTNPTEFTVESDEITIDGSLIAKDGYTFTSATPATIAAGTYENKEVKIVLTAVAETYTVTAAKVTGATVTFTSETTVESGETVTFTVAVTDDTKEIDTVKAGETTLTADEDGVYSVEVTADVEIVVTLKAKSVDPTLPTYIEGKSEATVNKYKAWAATYGADTESAYEEAYLLNCATDEDSVAAAKAAFNFTAIVPGEIPTIEGDFNGELLILGGTSLDNIGEWSEATKTDNFFKATLVVEKPVK